MGGLEPALVLYFAALGAAALTVMRAAASSYSAALANIYSACAIAICWKLILDFMSEQAALCGCGGSALDLFHCDTEAWEGLRVFELAYVRVTDNAGGWAWSSQLLVFVVPACAFVHLEMARRGQSWLGLAFITLGFLGAISAMFPVFLAIVAAAPPAAPGAPVPVVGISLVLASAVGLGAALLLPLTVHEPGRGVYNAALMTVHGVLALPCLLRPALVVAPAEGNKTIAAGAGPGAGLLRDARQRTALFYAALCGAALAVHAHNLAVVALAPGLSLRGAFAAGVAAGFGNHCQASISLDLVFTTCATCVFLVTRPRSGPRSGGGGRLAWAGVAAALLTPVLSPGATLAAYLAVRELEYE